MHRLLTVLVLAAALSASPAVSAQEVTGPEQQPEWPGGKHYLSGEVIGEHHGRQPTGYWLFEPVVDTVEEAERPPHTVVILLHGYTAVDPL